MAESLYPLKFKPVLQESEWAGNIFAKKMEAGIIKAKPGTGIYWQLIDDGEIQSQIANGPYQDTTLRELVENFPTSLVGKKHVSEKPFPLCSRILDVGRDQPLEVHPPGQAGGYQQHSNTNAKFWHILGTEEQARITAGIAQRVTGQQLISGINKPKLHELTRSFIAREGDSFLIPPGIIHSLGAGNLVWELTQHTRGGYRLDSGENDVPTSKEEQEQALNAILLESRHNPRISRETSGFTHTRRIPLTPHCPYFLVDEIRLFDHIILRTQDNSFQLLFVRKGCAEVHYGEYSERLETGEVCCIPASMGEYKILTVDNNPAEILRSQMAPLS